MQEDEEQRERCQTLLTVDDVALAPFLVDDDRTEEVGTIPLNLPTLMIGFIVVEKLRFKVLYEFSDVLRLPLVLALIVVN